MTHQPNWFTGLVLSTVIGAFCFLSDQDYRDEFAESDNLTAIQQEEDARASREFAGQAVCGPAALAQWTDDKTLTCTPRRGRAYTVAEVK